MKYIDIHSHLNLQPLSENREAVLAKMRELSVGTITIGTDPETSKLAIEIAEANPEMCWATVGIHPTDVASVVSFESDDSQSQNDLSDSEWAELESLAQHPVVVAIGETGLDYFRDQSDETKQKQVELFKKHIALALKINKPLMLHVRASAGTDDAYYDALEILVAFSPPYQGGVARGTSDEGVFAEQTPPPVGHLPLSRGGNNTLQANFHFFSGSKQCMVDIVAAKFTISVDGPITFSNDYDDMIRACPIESLMAETDAPFAAPVPYRGKTCEPWMVVEVVKKIAELKGVDEDTVRLQMLENTKKFFSI